MKKIILAATFAMTITACSPQDKVVDITPETTVTESVLKVQLPPKLEVREEKRSVPAIVNKAKTTNKVVAVTTPVKPEPAKAKPVKLEPVKTTPVVKAVKVSSVQQNLINHMLKYKVSKSNANKWSSLLIKHSKTYGVDPYVLLAMIQVETGKTFNPNLVGRDNDVGLLQIRPTAQNATRLKGNRKNPSLNIEIGAKYLAYNQKRFGHDLGIVAYNQGEGNVSKGTYNTKYLSRVNVALSTISR